MKTIELHYETSEKCTKNTLSVALNLVLNWFQYCFRAYFSSRSRTEPVRATGQDSG